MYPDYESLHCSQYHNCCCPVPGPAGPQGPTGAQGPAGPRGDTGAQGPAGPRGDTGAQGPAGAQGPVGIQGPEGPRGVTGPEGPEGPKGATGIQGSTGPEGPRGITGPAGPRGMDGTRGAVGIQGPTGPQGPIGHTGPAGIQGPAGPQGPAGIQGPTGPQGPEGPVIAAGASVSSHAAQTFTAPNYGPVTFDRTGFAASAELTPNGKYVAIDTAGLYLINYGVYSSVGAPGLCTIAYTPGGLDRGGRIPLSANAMISGSIVRSLGAQTRISLWIESADNNTPVTIPATSVYANAYLTISRIGPYVSSAG